MVPSVAFKKLSKAWKLWKWDAEHGVQENGVQITVEHDEWAEIIKAINSTIFINPGGE